MDLVVELAGVIFVEMFRQRGGERVGMWGRVGANGVASQRQGCPRFVEPQRILITRVVLPSLFALH